MQKTYCHELLSSLTHVQTDMTVGLMTKSIIYLFVEFILCLCLLHSSTKVELDHPSAIYFFWNPFQACVFSLSNKKYVIRIPRNFLVRSSSAHIA